MKIARPMGRTRLRRITLVPRTHFDLAWWAKWTIFRHMFEGNFAGIVRALETHPELRFTLDSQTELALWWLEGSELPSERRRRNDRLVRLIESGQLQVGPGMVLPDMFLTDPELIADNQLVGERIGRELGVPRAVGVDFSDIFGYPAELPKLLGDFGHRVLFLSRGVPTELADEPAFWWQAADGSRVLVVVQLGGYDSGRRFGEEPDRSVALIARLVNRFGARMDRAGMDDLIVYVGTDHSGIRDNLAEHVRRCEEAYPHLEFRIATNEEYARDLPIETLNLKTWTGELAGTVTRDRPILRGVSSSRMYLKQANERIVRIARQAERACALAVLRRCPGFGYPQEAFTHLKRRLLVLQSHDALTGCGVDAVARDMLAVYDDLEVLANRLRHEALAALAGRHAEYGNGFQYGMPPSGHFSLWNPLPYRTSQVAVLDLPEDLRGTGTLAAQTDGQQRPVQRLGTDQVAVSAELGGFGSTTIELSRRRRPALANRPSGRQVIDNGLVRVQAARNGTVELTDLRTGQQVAGLLRFQSIGDRGDLYNFDASGEAVDTRTERAEIHCVASGPLVWELEIRTQLRLPGGLDPRMPHQYLRWAKIGIDWAVPRARLPRWFTWREQSKPEGPDVLVAISTRVRLTAGSGVVDCETTVDNRARDHRLRVVFPVGERVEHSRAESTFGVRSYPIESGDPDWKARTTWMEQPFNEHVTQGWVAAGRMAVFSRGLPEFEVVAGAESGEIELTLLRCVGRLSKDNLTSRRGGAGPGEATPEAQSPGEHSFSYAFTLLDDQDEIALTRSSQQWRNGLVPSVPGLDTNDILDCQDDSTVFSTLKGAENGNGTVYRAWAGNRPAKLDLTGRFTESRRVDLREDDLEPDGPELHPGQTATVRLTN
ncbi:MAG TPA: glycoside hydrolase family 38 C-terminal domain-containing protein [Pseudonocardiaceae bacterium]|nr:glycoside hydrolase family 38 C-terminal domain-containing protein [Pseudonocardiaceae bacterium]